MFVGIMAVEGSGDAGVWIIRPNFVPRDLLAKETIIRFVFVERFDDVIAIAPDVGPRFILFETLALGVAGEVQPMPRPAFAVMGRGQELLDHLLEGLRRSVGQESIHFLWSWRQADQIEIRPAQQ